VPIVNLRDSASVADPLARCAVSYDLLRARGPARVVRFDKGVELGEKLAARLPGRRIGCVEDVVEDALGGHARLSTRVRRLDSILARIVDTPDPVNCR
jgi:hypothetical protein